MEQLLNKYNFKQTDTNTFTDGYWNLKIWYKEFEIYSDPEIDIRYYNGTIDQLEFVLQYL